MAETSSQRSLRIVHVANFGFRPVKVFLHHVAFKLSNGWTRGGHHVIDFSDRDVARWNGLFGRKAAGARKANAIFCDYCLAVEPDVIALGHADVIETATLADIRAALPRLKILQWNVDWLAPESDAVAGDATSSNNRTRLTGRLPVVDATFVTTAGPLLAPFATGHRVAGFMPNPVDRSIERGRVFESAVLGHDVFFAAGSEDSRRFHCGAWRDMNELARALESGVHGLRLSLHGLGGQPVVFGPAYERAILDCGIGLNISRRNDIPLYSSDRIAHLAGNGLVVCIDRATGYDAIFGDDEFSFYSSESELIENVARLKRDDATRRAMGERSWRRYFELFNSTMVGRYMLDATMGEHDPSRYTWPTLVSP